MTGVATRLLSPVVRGILASNVLLGVYFSVLTAVSGWNFAKDQFTLFEYFVVSLAVGFGIQVGLSFHMRKLIKDDRGHGAVLGVTGTTSTATMISCCTHYLVNLLPILGVTGIVTIVAQYQIELFWIGILLNLAGIVYIAHRIRAYNKRA